MIDVKKLPLQEQEIIYPESDGKAMADNTLQFNQIVLIKTNLDILYLEREVFVAGDLFWYPVEGNARIFQAPDVMVSFERPKGFRSSYKQWEEGNKPPEVVFEVYSKGNNQKEMLNKLRFYEQYGVEEYIYIEPYRQEFEVYVRSGSVLEKVSLANRSWRSEKMEIAIEVGQDETLHYYYPDGQPFRMPEELEKQMRRAMQREQEERAEKERERAAKERERAAKERERAAKEQALELAERERLAKEQALLELERLRAELAGLKK